MYILNPFIYIYYYLNEDDFSSGEGKNFFYFIINIILALIISFFGCVYNEFLVVTCCGLGYETHSEIALRSIYASEEKIQSELEKVINDDDTDY